MFVDLKLALGWENRDCASGRSSSISSAKLRNMERERERERERMSFRGRKERERKMRRIEMID